ncbi:MOSC domain-containing protein [Bdellovibrio sp. NC01]|uniref:MOSC domain-containing protein n=1 Tax=Bdellovibrio sp. NC01 TaxID=2220073 RepID=UPI00115A1C77|nr:MOSC domain-containing protein [Bdellovibrio sp. NC01]QDK36564.1 MOSC domain-containing protein [Bdellovibrio sp. NC01]
MKILSIQVGLPKTIQFKGKDITTGIFKNPIAGPVKVEKLNIVGDRQADLTVHGGVDKAVYAYSVDAYPWWQEQRPQDEFKFGAFGENLSMETLDESQICVGDTFEIGGAILQAAQPRFPCFKLGAMYNDLSIVKTFTKSGRPGVYFRVLQEGMIDVGQSLKLVSREKILLPIVDLVTLSQVVVSPSQAEQYIQIPSLPEQFRDYFFQVLED